MLILPWKTSNSDSFWFWEADSVWDQCQKGTCKNVNEYNNETVRPAAKPTRTTEKTVFLSTSELIYPTRMVVKHAAMPYIMVGRV